MMEYKFRGFATAPEKWVYGNLMEKYDPTKKENIIWCRFIQDKAISMEQVAIDSVGQFTGLLDKNGKEIYEGDICRVLYTDWGSKSDNDPRSIEQYIHDISKVCIVEFIDYEWAFNFGPNRYGEIGYGSFHVGAHGYVELVGNKFENPDLINPT